MSKIYIILFLSFICVNICGASTDSRKAFIKKYKSIAIEEMDRTGIPASIKLAQGMLESGCGTSKLAVNANNHFGIKCHNWNGASFTMDDDKRNECFRKYRNPEESWVDHSEFLLSRPRYAFLFACPKQIIKAGPKVWKKLDMQPPPITHKNSLKSSRKKNYINSIAQAKKSIRYPTN